MKKVLAALFLALCVVMPAAAHGTSITYSATGETVTIVALFDDLEPMAEAQILVYAPNDPETVYHRGTADADGHYTFDIDTALSGSWDITVRVASHGELIHIPVANGLIGQQSTAFTASGMFRTIASVLVLTTLAGVAYYFSRPKPDPLAPIPSD